MTETTSTTRPERTFKAWLDMADKIDTIKAVPNVTLAMKSFCQKYDIQLEWDGFQGYTLENAKVEAHAMLGTIQDLFYESQGDLSDEYIRAEDKEQYDLFASPRVRQTEYGLSREYAHIDISICRLEKERNANNPYLKNGYGVRGLSSSNYDLHLTGGVRIGDLLISCQIDKDGIYGFTYEYRTYAIDESDAEAMFKSLRRIRKGMERKYNQGWHPESYGEWALGVMEALGVVGMINWHTDITTHNGYYTYTDFSVETLDKLPTLVNGMADREQSKLQGK